MAKKTVQDDENDVVLDWMKKNKVRLTQRNYLALAYLGQVPRR